MTAELEKLDETPRTREHGVDRILVAALLAGMVVLFATNAIAWLNVNDELRSFRAYAQEQDRRWAAVTENRPSSAEHTNQETTPK